MATWTEVSTAFRTGPLPANQLNDTAWSFEVLNSRDGKYRKVFVFHEVVAPGMEFLKVSASVPFDTTSTSSLGRLFKQVGSLISGSLSFLPQVDDDGKPMAGIITFGSTFPLQLVDLTDINLFYLYLNLVSNSIASIQEQAAIAGGGPADGEWQSWLTVFPGAFTNDYGSTVIPFGRTIVLCKPTKSPAGDPMVWLESPFLLDIPCTSEVYELIAVSSRDPQFGSLVTSAGSESSQICLALQFNLYLENLSADRLRKTVHAIGTEALANYDKFTRVTGLGGHLNL